MASDELQIVNELLEGVDLGGLTLQERRAFFAAAAAPPPTGTTVDAVDADGVPAEWVTAAGVTGQRAVLFFPGGAYHVGSLATLRHLVALVSDAAQARVLNAGYRLAPEHPFPAAVHDALTAYRWLLARGIAPGQIAIAGNSSGGGLALALLVALRDAGEPMPAAAVAISPWTDLEMTGESRRTRAAVDRMITPDGMKEAADWYLAGQDPRHRYASPVHADLQGLPPVLIHVGDTEILLDDSTRFAARARAAGVEVTLEVWDEMPHCWHTFAGFLPEADRAIERIGTWLQERIPAG
jgi:epsilon-lactone hydrolase